MLSQVMPPAPDTLGAFVGLAQIARPGMPEQSPAGVLIGPVRALAPPATSNLTRLCNGLNTG
jgi:hypothetical protein